MKMKLNDNIESKAGAWEFTRDAESGQRHLHYFKPDDTEASVSIPITQAEFQDLETLILNVKKHASQFEIERKFLLKKLPHAVPDEVIVINQYYGEDADKNKFRIRQSMHTGRGMEHTKTVKTLIMDGVFEEEEEVISADLFMDLREFCTSIIRKTRYVYTKDDSNLKWEVDHYHDIDGLITAEIELPDIEFEFETEDFMQEVMDREVTGDKSYFNSNLAKPYKAIVKE